MLALMLASLVKTRLYGPVKIIGNLRNYDDNSNEKPHADICIFDNKQRIFARFARAFFIF